jgi:predicted N-formylglutamate amidohydrolase
MTGARAKADGRLLAADEPPTFTVEQPEGRSPFFFAADHAGKRMPPRLGSLGLSAAECERHIAWDIGIAQVSRLLSRSLDAFLILQTYSRLVIDCNRSPAVASSICEVSESTAIPGNRHIAAADRARRVAEVFDPYHRRIADELDRRDRERRPTILVAMHSFTPVFKDVARPWHVGVLYNRDPRLARIMLALFRAEGDLVVGDNEPYRISDETDYTIPVHGEQRGVLHVELEIRQDLIEEGRGQQAWAGRLQTLLPEALRRLGDAR